MDRRTIEELFERWAPGDMGHGLSRIAQLELHFRREAAEAALDAFG